MLLQRLADRRCDAIVSDAPILGAERAAVPDSYGPLAGQIRTNERYGAVLPQGSALKPAVNTALKALIADGTVGQLSKRWLTVDVSQAAHPALAGSSGRDTASDGTVLLCRSGSRSPAAVASLLFDKPLRSFVAAGRGSLTLNNWR